MVLAVSDEVVTWAGLWRRGVLSDVELQTQLRTLLTASCSDEVMKWADLWMKGVLSDDEFRAQLSKSIPEAAVRGNPGGVDGISAASSLPDPYGTADRTGGSRDASMLMVTTNVVPGYEIVEVHGDVFGLTVRARNYFSNRVAGLRTLTGGEVGGYTKLLAESRNEARGRLMVATLEVGGNAIVGMRFDCNEIGGIMTEIAAYGTAVTLSPDPRGRGVGVADRAQSE
jgi:uncharacterized protein YbjQ (UPF0145 family)